MQDFLTPAQAAKRLGIAQTTIYKTLRLLGARRRGGRWYIPVEAVENEAARRSGLNTVEAATQLRVTPQDVRDWLTAGAFPNAARLGGTGQWRIPLTDLERFAEGGENGLL
jgi:predicted site-specific integrase-resolvase